MKTLLIYHEGARLDEDVILRWLASFSELVGTIVLQEARGRKWTRVRREIKRVGFFRFADVVAFRAFYRFFLRRKDDAWEARFSSELAGRYPPLDVNLPVFDGWEVCRRIKARRDVPVLLLTVRAERADMERSQDAGADDHLLKPFEIGAFLKRIAAISARVSAASSSTKAA